MWSSLPDEVVKHLIGLAPAASLPVLTRLERRTHPAAERLASMKLLFLDAQEDGLINWRCQRFDADAILGQKEPTTELPYGAPPGAPFDPFWYCEAGIYQCTWAGMQILATSLDAGAFPQIRRLDILYTNLEDSTLCQLIGPLSRGALPSLVTFCLSGNFAGDPFMIGFSDAIAKGALSTLRDLDFSRNNIGDAGVASFAGACRQGALPRLTTLSLTRQVPLRLGVSGIQALAAALSDSALPSLTLLLISIPPEWNGQEDSATLEHVCKKRAIQLNG